MVSARGVMLLVAAACGLAFALASDAPVGRAAASLPSPPAIDFSRTAALPVVDVRAGNEVVVQLAGEQRALRLIGVFTPKAGSPDDAARAHVQTLLRGESVYVRYEADWPLQDRDQRFWAYAWRAPDGLFLNLEVLRLGLGRLSAPEPFEHQALFAAYEAAARRSQRGLWAPREDDAASTPNPVPQSQPIAAPPPTPTSRPVDGPTMVYVTRSGERYHREGCSSAAGGSPLSLEEAKSRGLTPCARCRPPA